MSKTFGDIFTEVTGLSGNEGNTFSDGTSKTTQIKSLINNYLKRIRAIGKTYEGETAVSIGNTVASTQEYAIASNIDKINTLTVEVADILYYPEVVYGEDWDKLYVDKTTTSDIPTYYTIQDNKIKLYPTPSASGYPIVAHSTVKITALVNSTDVLDLKEGYEDLVVYGPVADLMYGEENYSGGGAWEGKYKNLFKDYKEDIDNPTKKIIIKKVKTEPINQNNFPTLS